MRKEQIKRDVQAGLDEFARLQKAVAKYQKKSDTIKLSEDDTWELKNSISMVLQSVYTGFENALERIIKRTDGPQQESAPSYHKMLLERASHPLERGRPAIISATLKVDLIHLLGFRHVVRKKYAQEVDFEKAMENYHRAEKALPQFKLEIHAFLDVYLDDSDKAGG